MRKWTIIITLALVLSGCQWFDNDDIDEAKFQRYSAYYTSIFDNDRFILASEYYDIEVVMNKISDAEYRYDVIIDSPRIAMYAIEVMVVENNITPEVASKMMPTIGIFEEVEYNLIPYQVNVDKGYVKGLIVNGISSEPTINLKIMVLWRDYAKLIVTREFFDINKIYYNGTPIEEPIGDDEGRNP
ncbi:MAG: lipoprotein [Erysipelotrichaceae bacterium]|nr:lipoprotein [Erysipelotrichaceae bacterium]MDP3306148.1 lipoprotein [Erysipelotrichaceae bacterium]